MEAWFIWFIWYIGIWVLVEVLSILDARYKKKPFYYRDHYPIDDDH